MVFKGKIDAKTKALVKFLREESLLTVQEITKRCGVSRGIDRNLSISPRRLFNIDEHSR